MVVYAGGCLLSILIGWIGMHTVQYQRHDKHFVTVFLSALPLIVIASIRYDVGTDYFGYKRVFEYLKIGIESKEYIFESINKILVKLNADFSWIFPICAVIFCLCTYYIIFDLSPYPLLSIFLLVGMTHYFAFLNIMRQMVGASIALYAFKYIKNKDNITIKNEANKNLLKYIACIAIATGFHYSCILFLPAYWLSKMNLSWKKTIIIFVVFLVGFPLVEKVIYLIINNTQYAFYLDKTYGTGEFGYIYLAIQLFILIFAMLLNKHDNPVYQALYNIQFLNVCVSCYSGSVVLIERFRYLLGFPAIILIPMAVENMNSRMFRTLAKVAIVVLFGIYAYVVTVSGNNGVLPYKTIFQK